MKLMYRKKRSLHGPQMRVTEEVPFMVPDNFLVPS